MDGLIEPTPVTEERDSSRRTIAIAVTVVIAIAVIFAFLLRSQPKTASGPPPYAANLKLSDFKMSAAENFVGATVSYVDGTVTNAGDKTVTHVVVEVIFKDDMGQLAQREDIPMQVLKTDGPYPEAVDFSVSPLGPGQSKPFRLTFEGISAQWNRQYPEITVTDVAVK
jgi:heme/copper-type cytochrome/quinol oxidase subunit 2